MSYRLKLILGIVTIEAIVLGLLLLFGVQWLHQLGNNELKLRAKNLAETAVTVVRDPILVLDIATLQSFATGFINTEGVLYIRIYDTEGVLAEAGEGKLLAKKYKQDTDVEKIDDGSYDTHAEVIIEEEKFGRIEIGLSDKEVEAFFHKARKQATMNAILILGVVAFFSWIFGTYLTKRLARLVDGANKIRSGDYTHRIKVSGSDELDQVAHAYNNMVSELQEVHEKLHQAKEMALQSAEAKANFLANMSHEIRTPLNGVYGTLKLLEDTSLTAKQSAWLTTALKSSDALMSVINDILDFSKIDAGHLELENNPFDIVAEVEALVEMLNVTAHNKGVYLLSKVDSNLPAYILGDKTRFGQVLLNLCSNAIKFTESGGTVLIELKHVVSTVGKVEDELHISVTDTGIGIAADKIAGLFEEFSQEDSSTTRRFGGTGLGLAISKKIVDLMHGEISVTSEKDVGSCFVVNIPLHICEDSQPEKHAQYPEQHALIVEPSTVYNEILSDYLAYSGIVVERVDTASAALDSIKIAQSNAMPITLLLMSAAIYASGGRHVLQLLRNERASKDIRYVLLSDPLALKSESYSMIIDSKLNIPYNSVDIERMLAHMFGSVDEIDIKPEPVKQWPVFEGVRILLAEDNPTNQMIAQEVLVKAGIDVLTVENGKEVLALFQDKDVSIDLILMDCQMPIMDGYAATKAIRCLEKESGASPVPIVALTAKALEGDDQRSYEVGMDAYMSKPFEPHALLLLLKKYLPERGTKPNQNQA